MLNEDFDDVRDEEQKPTEIFWKPRPCDNVWREVTGKWPEGVVVHVNGKSDDRFENLKLIPWLICTKWSTTTAKEEKKELESLAAWEKNGLARYLNKLNKFTALKQQEEYALAKCWREHGDRAAWDTLITSHLPLVVKIAKIKKNRMADGHYRLEDMISEGVIGLMMALLKFDPEKGFRLATCAWKWIENAIAHYCMHFRSLVKIGTTDNEKKLFFNLRKVKRRNDDMKPDLVKFMAERLGVTEQEVIDMNGRLSGDASLNETAFNENGEEVGELIDLLADGDHQPQKNGGAWWFGCDNQESRLIALEQSENEHKAIVQSLDVLDDERERRIFMARRLAYEPSTPEQLAAELNISPRRVRQIEADAVEKVKKADGQWFAAGDKVLVTDGLFATFSGVVEEVNEARQQLKATLSARDSTIVRLVEGLKFSQVEKCNGAERREVWTANQIKKKERA